MKVDRKSTHPDLMNDAAERGSFQLFLDEYFPIGATCAVIGLGTGHLDGVSATTTGRLVCADSEEDQQKRRWYKIVIDPQGSDDVSAKVVQLWIRRPQPLAGIEGLWQAEVRSEETAERILRLNAEPPSESRPTPAMRAAVTDAYSKLLSSPELP
jgi:hypothetical protein